MRKNKEEEEEIFYNPNDNPENKHSFKTKQKTLTIIHSIFE